MSKEQGDLSYGEHSFRQDTPLLNGGGMYESLCVTKGDVRGKWQNNRNSNMLHPVFNCKNLGPRLMHNVIIIEKIYYPIWLVHNCWTLEFEIRVIISPFHTHFRRSDGLESGQNEETIYHILNCVERGVAHLMLVTSHSRRSWALTDSEHSCSWRGRDWGRNRPEEMMRREEDGLTDHRWRLLKGLL